MMFYLTFTICTKFKLSKNLDNHHSELKWVNLKFKVSSPPSTMIKIRIVWVEVPQPSHQVQGNYFVVLVNKICSSSGQF